MLTQPVERRAKIVATLGPASDDEDTLQKLIQAGMNVARLNFSHGTHDQHAIRIEQIRRISHRLGQAVTILQDLQGPKIRVGDLKDGKVTLLEGQTVTFTTRPILGDHEVIPVDYTGFPRNVQPGGRILLSDGQMELQVSEVSEESVKARVILGGILTPRKGINLPGVRLDIPCFTEKDENDLQFGLAHGIDAVAMSFIRTAKDIERVRRATACLGAECVQTPIIAKMERPESLENLEEIIVAADGVMVARGDLAVEMSPEEVPIAQKRIIASANKHAKVVITATQMLESMIQNPRPTRAEASDVANAVFDGTDAVMLSAETAAGQYPVKSVEMMASIVCQAEKYQDTWGHWHGAPPAEFYDDAVFVTRAAREVALDRNVAAIAVFTNNGRTALLMSKERPTTPILAFTPSENTYNRLAMYWGVIPYLVTRADTVEKMLEHVEAAMVSQTVIRPGQQVVLVCGFPVNAFRAPNLVLLHTVRSS